MNYQTNTILYQSLSLFLLLNVLITVEVTAATAENETTSRTLQAGGSYRGSSSSSSSSGTGTALAVGALAGLVLDDDTGFFKSTGGKIFLGVIVVITIAGIIYRGYERSEGEAPAEEKFFEGNGDQGQEATDNDSDTDQFEDPFYSGLYSGIYDQGGTHMPVQPFEIYFQEEFIDSDDEDDDDNGPITIFHTITGKGADTVGPYTLSGKSVGNKVSITKKYYGAGDHITDIGHMVTLRLDKLGDTHIFEGEYFVDTDQVQEKGLYQIWPVDYNNKAAMQTHQLQQQQQQYQQRQQAQQQMYTYPPVVAFTADEENQVPIATAQAVEEQSEEFQTISLDSPIKYLPMEAPPASRSFSFLKCSDVK